MKIERNEIKTGLLVILSLGFIVAVLIYLGSPGVFVPQKTFYIYFDNAAGLKPGADVMLAGRKIGRVKSISSPVPADQRPDPKMEVLVEVEVVAAASVYRQVKVVVAQPNLLAEPVIDFVEGKESSGWAPEGSSFIGERPASLTELVPAIVSKIEPAMATATATLESLQKSADNLTKMTEEGGDLSVAFAELRQFATNIKDVSGESGPLRKSLENIEAITGPDGKIAAALDNIQELTGPAGPLANTLANAETFTESLVENKDVEAGLRSFRKASDKLDSTLSKVGPRLDTVSSNLVDASDTVKHQPWRLIWPSTKKYPEDEEPATATATTPGGKSVTAKPPLRSVRPSRPAPTWSRR